ncbi:phosphoribosylglycinamide formyltransferase [Oscillatoria amoena NRMC-F 0135]|nr:phosphoribosylglycinamide formyltransferase [Oscillatoria laete-virens]MCD8486516.1 phosphoribosylglycinamide formyltransferase [Desertifilum sp.]MDL5047277.1 phosphoribosylglycinamide formyltransferase [Oscillatoria amoena NRMC-F 0135]MDL5052485.1 phosphoribosylglycinamide formyltransferase [Oscillatoria laete-virens NRMC-F 0139]
MSDFIDSTPASLIVPDEFLPALDPESPLKLGVLASGSGTNFEALIQAIAAQQLSAKIQVLIYNNPGAKVAARAQRWSVPTVFLNHRDYTNREEFDAKIVDNLRQFDVDWVIMAGWMRKATPILIDAFPNKVINIHPSLLPSFRGINAIEQALAAGVKITGCTVHLVRLEVDAGPILMQAAVPILPDDTAETLHARVQIQEHRILPRAIALAAAQQAGLYPKNY